MLTYLVTHATSRFQLITEMSHTINAGIFMTENQISQKLVANTAFEAAWMPVSLTSKSMCVDHEIVLVDIFFTLGAFLKMNIVLYIYHTSKQISLIQS
jgi:hypothetical protein